MESNYRVYRYTNLVNGMKYYGTSGTRLQCMRTGHNGSTYIKSCRRFGDAIQEYGWSNFKYEVVEDGLTKEEAFEREKHWIEYDNTMWPNGYNLEGGGKQGHIVHMETRKRHEVLLKGHITTEETKEKIRQANTGKKRSEDTCRKIGESKKGVFINDPKRSKAVCQFTKDGQFIKEYPSISEASRQTGIKDIHISMVCRNIPTHNTAGGFIWKYAE